MAVGDVDHDGNPEIIVLTYNFAYYEQNKRIWVHAFKTNGTELQNFPVEISGLFAEFRPGITLADLDNDHLLEIVLTTTKTFVVVKSTGTYRYLPQTNFPATFIQLFGSVVANIDNDTDMEIVAPVLMDNTLGTPQDSWGTLYAWNPDGTEVTGFPIKLPVVPTTMLSIANIYGDNRPEVAGGYVIYDNSGTPIENGVYIQTLPGRYPLGRVEWGTYAHDVKHTNAHT